MRLIRFARFFLACTSLASLGVVTLASDVPVRQELNRVALSATAEMEVISSVTELKPGEELARHFHHGVESAYVLQGSMVQFPGKPPAMLASGTAIMNLRDVPHAGFKVVGEQPLRLFTVHIVDKGKPLYEWVR